MGPKKQTSGKAKTPYDYFKANDGIYRAFLAACKAAITKNSANWGPTAGQFAGALMGVKDRNEDELGEHWKSFAKKYPEVAMCLRRSVDGLVAPDNRGFNVNLPDKATYGRSNKKLMIRNPEYPTGSPDITAQAVQTQEETQPGEKTATKATKNGEFGLRKFSTGKVLPRRKAKAKISKKIAKKEERDEDSSTADEEPSVKKAGDKRKAKKNAKKPAKKAKMDSETDDEWLDLVDSAMAYEKQLGIRGWQRKPPSDSRFKTAKKLQRSASFLDKGRMNLTGDITAALKAKNYKAYVNVLENDITRRLHLKEKRKSLMKRRHSLSACEDIAEDSVFNDVDADFGERIAKMFSDKDAQ